MTLKIVLYVAAAHTFTDSVTESGSDESTAVRMETIIVRRTPKIHYWKENVEKMSLF